MADLALIAKRQAIALGYKVWIQSVTGEFPNSKNLDNGVAITWKPGQAKKMKDSFLQSMEAAPSPDDINVSLPWGEVLIPLIFEKYWMFMAGGAAALIGVGFLLKR